MKLKAAVLFQCCRFLETKTIIDALFSPLLKVIVPHILKRLKCNIMVSNIISKSLPTMKLINHLKAKKQFMLIFFY